MCTRTVEMALVLSLSALGACSSGSSNPAGSQSCTSSAQCAQGEVCGADGKCALAPDAGGPQPCTKVAVPWLAEGNFWQVAWSEIDFEIGLFNSTGKFDVGSYSMKLGSPVTSNGMQMFPLQLNGDVRKYTPRWTSVGTDGCGNIFGAKDGQVVRVYSTTDATWTGSGFWTAFAGYSPIAVNRNATVIPSEYTKRVTDIFSPPLTSVGYSSSQSGIGAGTGCEYFSGYGTICGSDSPGASTYQFLFEYWSGKAGPVAMAYAYDYDSGDSPRTRRHAEQRAEVWFFGDVTTNNYRFENEPDSYVAPTPLTIPGDEHIFTMYGEVSNYDKPAGAIPGVSAVISDQMYAQIKSWYPFGQQTGQTVAESIQDWFSFELTDVSTRVEFYLVWDDDTTLELHWFAAPGNSTYGFLYFGQDYLDVTGAFPEFKHKKGIPNPTVPGKYLIGVRRTAPSQFATPYAIFVLK